MFMYWTFFNKEFIINIIIIIIILQPVAVKIFAAIGDIHPLKMLRREVIYISIYLCWGC
jgi:hypothetical protein